MFCELKLETVVGILLLVGILLIVGFPRNSRGGRAGEM